MSNDGVDSGLWNEDDEFDCLPSSCLHESTVTSISGTIVAIAIIRNGLESEDGADGHRFASFREFGSPKAKG